MHKKGKGDPADTKRAAVNAAPSSLRFALGGNGLCLVDRRLGIGLLDVEVALETASSLSFWTLELSRSFCCSMSSRSICLAISTSFCC